MRPALLEGAGHVLDEAADAVRAETLAWLRPRLADARAAH